MSEATIQAALQSRFQAMDEFDSADVVINDWGFIKVRELKNAPFLIIENSDDFESNQNVATPVTVWDIPITLITQFKKYKTSLDEFRTTRQAIIDRANDASTDIRVAGASGTNVISIISGSPIEFELMTYTDTPEESTPVNIRQRMLFRTEEF